MEPDRLCRLRTALVVAADEQLSAHRDPRGCPPGARRSPVQGCGHPGHQRHTGHGRLVGWRSAGGGRATFRDAARRDRRAALRVRHVQCLQPPPLQRGDSRHRPCHAAGRGRPAGLPAAAPHRHQAAWLDPAAERRRPAGVVLGALELDPAGQQRTAGISTQQRPGRQARCVAMEGGAAPERCLIPASGF